MTLEIVRKNIYQELLLPAGLLSEVHQSVLWDGDPFVLLSRS